jgi:hypothetical protein
VLCDFMAANATSTAPRDANCVLKFAVGLQKKKEEAIIAVALPIEARIQMEANLFCRSSKWPKLRQYADLTARTKQFYKDFAEKLHPQMQSSLLIQGIVIK